MLKTLNAFSYMDALYVGIAHKLLACLQPIEKQPFLDSGILCCLIHVLNALLAPDMGNQRLQLNNDEELILADEKHGEETRAARRLEVVVLLVKLSRSILNASLFY